MIEILDRKRNEKCFKNKKGQQSKWKNRKVEKGVNVCDKD